MRDDIYNVILCFPVGIFNEIDRVSRAIGLPATIAENEREYGIPHTGFARAVDFVGDMIGQSG